MGRIGQLAETTEGSGAAFDGMRRTKDGIEVVDVGVVDVEAEQQALHVGQQLIRLVEECLEKLTKVDPCTHSCFPLL